MTSASGHPTADANSAAPPTTTSASDGDLDRPVPQHPQHRPDLHQHADDQAHDESAATPSTTACAGCITVANTAADAQPPQPASARRTSIRARRAYDRNTGVSTIVTAPAGRPPNNPRLGISILLSGT